MFLAASWWPQWGLRAFINIQRTAIVGTTLVTWWLNTRRTKQVIGAEIYLSHHIGEWTCHQKVILTKMVTPDLVIVTSTSLVNACKEEQPSFTIFIGYWPCWHQNGGDTIFCDVNRKHQHQLGEWVQGGGYHLHHPHWPCIQGPSLHHHHSGKTKKWKSNQNRFEGTFGGSNIFWSLSKSKLNHVASVRRIWRVL